VLEIEIVAALDQPRLNRRRMFFISAVTARRLEVRLHHAL